jgi:hypothetical protein
MQPKSASPALESGLSTPLLDVAASSTSYSATASEGHGAPAPVPPASLISINSLGGSAAPASFSMNRAASKKNAAELRDLTSMKTARPSDITTLSWYFRILQLCMLLPDHAIHAHILRCLGWDSRVTNLIACVIGWILAGTVAAVLIVAPYFHSSAYQAYFLEAGIPVAALLFLCAGSVVVSYFIWPLGRDEPSGSSESSAFDEAVNQVHDPRHILPDFRLLRAETSVAHRNDFFAEILRNSETEFVESLSNYIAAFIALAGGPGSVVASIVFLWLGRLVFPASFLGLSTGNALTVVLWSGALCIGITFTASCYGTILLTVWLLRDRLNRYATWSAHCLNSRIAWILRLGDSGVAAPLSPASPHFNSSASGDDNGIGFELDSSLALDIVIRERYLVSSLIERASSQLSRAGVIVVTLIGLMLMTVGVAISVTGLNAFNIVIFLAAYVCLFFALFTVSLIQTGDVNFYEALLDLRGRIPVAFANERHEQGFRELRLELDSIISHCQNTPIGFRLFGILITPNLVAGALYSTLIALISLIASKISEVARR